MPQQQFRPRVIQCTYFVVLALEIRLFETGFCPDFPKIGFCEFCTEEGEPGPLHAITLYIASGYIDTYDKIMY